jgi:hypothetical protein
MRISWPLTSANLNGKRFALLHLPIRDMLAQLVWRLGYGLDDRGYRVRFSAGSGNFSLHHRVQTVSGAHPAFYPMGTRGSFPRVKAAGA